ncbi:MAG: type IX secretion system membrane protein PorP/SprF [Bacteroidales bacterium]|nr:type IX secretion system membrane protein PorP/SprF [Bacteroidales bacterium]MDD4384976.1 type IX secretion system membrane protein PorP/SprF [Bacteroidales bacterium]MDY0196481.1 type IX secretion system membrane protein PorP/SprF [Tenuifilaceae bacterium]
MKSLRLINFLTIVVVMLAPSGIKAQQDPIFTNYLQNPIAFNPAIAGTIDGLNLSLLTRHQWIGIDGAPTSYSFGAHTPYIKQNMGLGFNIMTDKAGPLRNTHITGSYAYRITVFPGVRLSMGLKAGISSYNAAVGGLQVNDPADPNFQTNEKRISPNLGVGFYLYAEKYYAGFSAPRLIEPRLNKEYRESKEPYNPQFYLMGGYNFSINNDWGFLPSALMGVMGGSPISADVTVQFIYIKRFYFGAHYRIGDASGLFVNAKITNDFTFGYAFDFTLNKLSSVNSGTHEFMLTYTFYGLWNTIQGWKF